MLATPAARFHVSLPDHPAARASLYWLSSRLVTLAGLASRLVANRVDARAPVNVPVAEAPTVCLAAAALTSPARFFRG